MQWVYPENFANVQRQSSQVLVLQPQFHTGKNKAKTAISVAVEAKPEVEIWRRPKISKEHW